MFIWDFDAFFSISLILCVGLVLTFWLRYNLNRDRQQEQEKVVHYLKHCHYCGYVYLDYLVRSSCRCPRCLSYHD